MATTGKGLPRSLKGVSFSASWIEITGKPAVIAAGANAAAAWGVISSAAIGTTATTAMAGNRTPTTTIRGGVLQAAAQANSAATDVAGLLADFNALLAKLRTAGVIAP